MRLSRRFRKKARIEMLPLIDAIFLILVFFVYAFLSMSIHRSIPVMLPRAETSTVEKRENIIIGVTREGECFFEKKKMAMVDMAIMIRERSLLTSDIVVAINADALAPHGKVIEIIDMLRTNGVERIVFLTESSST